MCAIARALELVGDRWTLLIIQQLLVKPRRYVDLQNALPGLSSGLLSERLKRLESDGLVLKRQMPPPIATAMYELTDFGREIEPVVLELMRWGSTLLADPDRLGERSDPNWPVLPLRWLAGKYPSSSSIKVVVAVAEDPDVPVMIAGTTVELLDEGSTDSADLRIEAKSSPSLVALLGGHRPIESLDVKLVGDSSWFTTALATAYGKP